MMDGSDPQGLSLTEQIQERCIEAAKMDFISRELEIDRICSDHKIKKGVINKAVQMCLDAAQAERDAQRAERVMSLPDEDWEARVITNRGNIVPCIENYALHIEHHPDLKGLFRYDEFASKVMLTRPLPNSNAPRSTWRPREITDADTINLVRWFHRHRIAATKGDVADTVHAVARDDGYHPVRGYLEGLEWDGESRIVTLFPSYFGAEANDYHRAVSRCFMISAVARIMQPGCKVDTVPVLEGVQGALKSTAVRVLASAAWFTDHLPDIRNKDAKLALQGVWIIEVSELAAFGKAAAEDIKKFFSERFDRFRPPYGREEIRRDRECVFVGTSNTDDYIVDSTGGRRFWPVVCGYIDIERLKKDRDQLWAEAVHMYREGVQWWLKPEEEALAAKRQASRQRVDSWHEFIDNLLAGRTETTIPEVMELLGLEPANAKGYDGNRIGAILRHLGFWNTGKQQTKTRYRLWEREPQGDAQTEMKLTLSPDDLEALLAKGVGSEDQCAVCGKGEGVRDYPTMSGVQPFVHMHHSCYLQTFGGER